MPGMERVGALNWVGIVRKLNSTCVNLRNGKDF